MGPKIVAIALIALGLLGLIYGGFNYTEDKHVAKLGSLEFSKQLLAKAKVSVSPGIGFGDHGDDHVRFALIENESRIRQAIRGIKAMLKADESASA